MQGDKNRHRHPTLLQLHTSTIDVILRTLATMSFISITAPIFTDHDERVERESMTPEEQEEVYNDIYGMEQFEETKEMVENGPQELEQALIDFHEEEKEEYLEAVRQCPEIVQEESNALMFIRVEHYNLWVCSSENLILPI